MLILTPFIPLFTSTLVIGTLIAISSPHWIFIWIGLEINLLSFIPLITRSINSKENEAAIKYFLAQALGRALLLLSALCVYIYPIVDNKYDLFIFILYLSILIKLGAAPCHFWLPQVINALPWSICIILTSWQKIAPLFIIIKLYISSIPILILTSIILRSIIGGLGGLNQTQIRPLLAYSRINHIGWIFAAIIFSHSLIIIYFIIYIITTIILIQITLVRSQDLLIPSKSIINIHPDTLSVIIFLLLSLGGLPPLIGFIPKWFVIASISYRLLIIPLIVLIIGSLIRLFYYLNIAFTCGLNIISFSLHRNNAKYDTLYLSIPFIIMALLIPTFFLIYALILLN